MGIVGYAALILSARKANTYHVLSQPDISYGNDNAAIVRLTKPAPPAISHRYS